MGGAGFATAQVGWGTPACGGMILQKQSAESASRVFREPIFRLKKREKEKENISFAKKSKVTTQRTHVPEIHFCDRYSR